MKRVLYLDNPRDFFGRNLSWGFINEATRHQWWTHWYHPLTDEDISSLLTLSSKADGVIYRGQNEEFIQRLKKKEIPHLHLRSTDADGHIGVAHVDDTVIGGIAEQEMDRLDVVHRGYLGYKKVSWSEARGVAYLKNNTNISYLELTPEEAHSHAGIEKIGAWLKKLPKPSGIFTANDHLGVAALISCQLENLEVPNQIAVIGVDNNAHRCDSISPPLSSIDLHAEELGKHLAYGFAQKLNLITDDANIEIPTLRPPSLVVRESSHHLNPNLVYYRKSIEWIYRNALQGPSVQELADEVNVSRRVLERSFKQNNAEPPATVIRVERMRQIKELLQRHNISQEHISKQANFPDLPSLSNFVKRMTGCSPGELRNT